jgi:phytoene desaturase
MMKKKVAIIGAGLTGLSAGIILQKQGIETEIYEKAPWAGGVCTAWTRKGYTFDGCIHWMVGTKESEPVRKLYEKIHALESDTTIFHMDSLIMEFDGATHVIPLDLDQFRDYLLDIAPQDSAAIHHFCKAIQKVSESEMIPGPPKTLAALIHAITRGRGFLSTISKYLNMTVETYFKLFTSEKIIKIIYHLMSPSFSMFALLMMLGTRMAQNGGFPMGGARDMIHRMQEHYTSLGGKITYNTQITEIVVADTKAIGVKSEQGIHSATHVIAACDIYDTLQHMLKGKYAHPVLDHMLKETPLFDTIMLISMGLSKSFKIPFSATYAFDEPFDAGDKTYVKEYHIRSFDFDPSFAPAGGSSIMVMLPAPFDYWNQLRKENEKAYRQEKYEKAQNMIECLEKRYPGIKTAIQVIDVATPSTYYRLNNLYKGSYEGFLPVPEALNKKIIKKIKGIDNLYLAGQWVTPGGGIPTAIMSGIETAERIIKSRR